jgi:hypothetical protein
MQTIATVQVSIEEVEALHEQAQEACDGAGRLAIKAVALAHKAGRALVEKRATFKRVADFDVWLEQHASESLREWSGRYVKIGQMELNFDATAALRQQMTLLELVPTIEREAADHSGDAVTLERGVLATIDKMQRLFGKIPAERRASYQVQFKQLFEWLKREVYAEDFTS